MMGPRLNAAYYAAPVSEFLAASDEEVYAPLAGPNGFTLVPEQLSAWRLQLPVLRAALADTALQKGASHHVRDVDRDGGADDENGGRHLFAPWIHLEFDIPRLGRRVDAVLVTREAIVPIEFKVGAKKFERLDYEQAWDYGLDLKNFHAPSHLAPIFPILCATEAPRGDAGWKLPHADGVRPPFCCNAESLGKALALALDDAKVPAASFTQDEETVPATSFTQDEEKVPATFLTDDNDSSADVTKKVAGTFSGLTPATWGTGSYSPTPTIIEAARALYARHTVHDITRSDAGAVNLAATSDSIEKIIAATKTGSRKAIVFVTGVPGAGKTLVGLNVATRYGRERDSAHAVFLSGNGPLVAVLREALARDELERRMNAHEKKVPAPIFTSDSPPRNGPMKMVAGTFSGRPRIGECRTAVKAFIQNVHHFRDDTLRSPAAPADHVVVFDEAQRAWDARQLASFMKRKKGLAGFTQTEPDVLLSAMDRHPDWAVVVCLVGGGQEINTGEAGISAWLKSLRSVFPEWDVFISPNLTDSEYAAAGALRELAQSRQEQVPAVSARSKKVPAPIFTSDSAPPSGLTKMVAGTFFPAAPIFTSDSAPPSDLTKMVAGTFFPEPALHLSTSMRSFRAENVSRFVKALLDGEADLGRELFAAFRAHYPVVLTRSMREARRWIKKQRRGTERAGLVASSSAQRLKPHAIDIRVNIDPVHWFLSSAKDTRSSLYLEDAATEFQVQGLELDWTIVTWDADLRWSGVDWSYHSFRGAQWTAVKKPERKQYLKNAYRVLLTRARQGMVIFVPPGAKRDRTRNPAFYEGVHEYLTDMGVPEV